MRKFKYGWPQLKVGEMRDIEGAIPSRIRASLHKYAKNYGKKFRSITLRDDNHNPIGVRVKRVK